MFRDNLLSLLLKFRFKDITMIMAGNFYTAIMITVSLSLSLPALFDLVIMRSISALVPIRPGDTVVAY